VKPTNRGRCRASRRRGRASKILVITGIAGSPTPPLARRLAISPGRTGGEWDTPRSVGLHPPSAGLHPPSPDSYRGRCRASRRRGRASKILVITGIAGSRRPPLARRLAISPGRTGGEWDTPRSVGLHPPSASLHPPPPDSYRGRCRASRRRGQDFEIFVTTRITRAQRRGAGESGTALRLDLRTIGHASEPPPIGQSRIAPASRAN
jgi:hypothetical protein